MAQTSNWFSNILPAIQALPGNLLKQAENVAKDYSNSPVGEFQSGKYSKILPTIISDYQNLNKSVAPGGPGFNPAVVGMALNTSGGESGGEAKFVEPENGGQFVNQNTEPLTGGTSAKVKAKPVTPPDLKYTPPAVDEGVPPQSNPAPNGTSGEQFNTSSQPGAESPQPNYSRTFDVTNPKIHPSAIDPHADMMRNLEVDGSDIKTQQQKAQVNATANGYGIKGSQTQQSGLIDDTVGTLAQRAKANIAATGGTIAKSDLVNEVAKGIFKVAGQHNIDPAAVMQTAEDTVDSAYARVKGVDASGNYATKAPDAIPGVDVQDMKTQLNSDSSSTFGKDPSTWTKAQKTARPARDAVDKLLGEQYPDAKKLNNDMSDLINAKESLRKGANTESTTAKKAYMDQEKAAQDAANQPKPSKFGKGAKILTALGIPTVAGLALTGTQAVMANSGQGYSTPTENGTQNSNGQNKPNNSQTQLPAIGPNGTQSSNHGNIIPNSTMNVKDLPTDISQIQPTNGKWDATYLTKAGDSSGNPAFISDDDLRIGNAQIQNYLNQHPNDGNAANTAATTKSRLQTAYDASAKTREMYNDTKSSLIKINNTLSSLNKSNTPDFLDAFEANLPVIGDVGMQEVHSTLNQSYGQLLSQAKTIDAIAAKNGIVSNIAGANSAASMRQRINLVAQTLLANLNNQAQTSGTSLLSQPVAKVPPGPAGNNGGSINTDGNTPLPTVGPIQMTAPNPGWGQIPQ